MLLFFPLEFLQGSLLVGLVVGALWFLVVVWFGWLGVPWLIEVGGFTLLVL